MSMNRMILFLILSIVACQPALAVWPGDPLEPRPEWRALWAKVEACVGARRSFDRIAWHRSPDGALGPRVMGRWVPTDDIYLTDFVVRVNLEASIMHEMAHAILQKGGDETWHPPEFLQCDL